ncbi:apolipoprotein N-acyltransferase [Sphingobium sp. CR2-8]|uniref:apolipoprotein N-acyltransferase n=1 Tax=Sphingobium sp. CR2-8 TaxID=1306534 RepID=UPI002DB935CD|nr:apolipoprotein N-acyltransferase [Sphingobium sp. CR2-8]MEC3911655.1 apolipoprotein N-acyltransferase [Sphingobium sp. CR2-8]
MRALLVTRPKLVALLAGFASATGFAPLDLWPVTLACLALLILLIERAPDRRAAFTRGWLFGVGHFTLGLNWIAHAFTFQDSMPHWFGYGAVVLLSLYLAVYPGLATLGAWWLSKSPLLPRRREPSPPASTGLPPARDQATPMLLPLLFAATWLASEYLRATLFTGFAWNPLGATLLPTGIGVAATLIGTYGLGALTILAAAALLLALRRQFRPAATIAAPLLALALWGLLSPAPQTPPGAPRIRVVQPNIGQDEKYSPQLEQAHFRNLAALSGTPRPAPRLIFWPEAAIPAYLDMEPDWRARLAGLLGPGDLLMTGATKVYFKPDPQSATGESKLAGANNSLFIVTPDARLAGRYDKAHLVPYGEYLPMRALLQPIGLSRLVPGDADFWPGPGPQSLTLPATLGRPDLKMGVQICYEIIFSGHVVDAANRPAFLFNPSNDAWFGSWGPVQHLAQARLRAIEEGIPIIRSTPTGVSAIIDARGHVVHALGLDRAGFLDSGLPPALPPTLFARLGNWASGLLMLLLLLGTTLALRRGKS